MLSCEAVRDADHDESYPCAQCGAKRQLKVQGSSDPPLKNDFSSYLELFEGIGIEGVLTNW